MKKHTKIALEYHGAPADTDAICEQLLMLEARIGALEEERDCLAALLAQYVTANPRIAASEGTHLGELVRIIQAMFHQAERRATTDVLTYVFPDSEDMSPS